MPLRTSTWPLILHYYLTLPARIHCKCRVGSGLICNYNAHMCGGGDMGISTDLQGNSADDRTREAATGCLLITHPGRYIQGSLSSRQATVMPVCLWDKLLGILLYFGRSKGLASLECVATLKRVCGAAARASRRGHEEALGTGANYSCRVLCHY